MSSRLVGTRAPASRSAALLCSAVLLSQPTPAWGDTADAAVSSAADVLPIGLARTSGGLGSPSRAPVTVRVVLLNVSRHDMQAADVAARRWIVEIQGRPGGPYVLERALRAGERHAFLVTVVVPCGKSTDLEVSVRLLGRLSTPGAPERPPARFPVEGNACPGTPAADADSTIASLRRHLTRTGRASSAPPRALHAPVRR